jgi:hypothetical protein
MSKRIQVGDWVRFYSNARLIIGKVEYVMDGNSWERGYHVQTDAGMVNSESVIEVRPAAKAEGR